MSMFHVTVLQLESQRRSALESAILLHEFRTKLVGRRDSNFCPIAIRKLLNTSGESPEAHTEFCAKSVVMYYTAVKYIDAWDEHVSPLRKLDSLLLKKTPKRENIQQSLASLQQMFPSTANFINDDDLFDEVTLILAFFD